MVILIGAAVVIILSIALVIVTSITLKRVHIWNSDHLWKLTSEVESCRSFSAASDPGAPGGDFGDWAD